MALWRSGGTWSTSGPASGALAGDPRRKSTLGTVQGGETEAAGTVLPADRGTVVIATDTETWIRISGTVAEPGDVVLHTFGGSPVTVPDNPANRRDTARVVSSGVIELALSATNPDASPSHWVVIK